ncbi:MAG TPA: S8 family serine peptidase, partial [Candidatus Omnitrophota bacterium]|nr:S8 family serine peptidase [Candidatus Omnitrophota bacterium]
MEYRIRILAERLVVAICFLFLVVNPHPVPSFALAGENSAGDEFPALSSPLGDGENTLDLEGGHALKDGSRLIVKLKKGEGYQAAAEMYVPGQEIFSKVSAATSLDVINQTHQVRTIKPVLGAKEKISRPFSLNSGSAKNFEKQRSLALKREMDGVRKQFSSRSNRRSFDAEQGDTLDQDALELASYFIVEFENEKDAEALKLVKEEYMKDPAVELVEHDVQMSVFYQPSDPFYHSTGTWGQAYSDMYALKPNRLHAGDPVLNQGAWAKTKGAGVVVAVIDTGVDYNHIELQGNIWINAAEIPNNGIDDDGNGFVDDRIGWNFIGNNNNPIDDHGHGTHCAGTIAAAENGLGIIGVAPQAKIMILKALGQSGSGSIIGLANAVIYAANNGADVISNSWGGGGVSQMLVDAFAYAHSLGCVSVAAAGNANADAKNHQPASFDTVITVSAVTPNDQKASFSNFGSKIDVAAPGVDILSLRAEGTDMYGASNPNLIGQQVVNDIYYRANGTSMACPHVSGVAALILAHHPNFSNEEVRAVLTTSADDLGTPGFDYLYGYGRVDAQEALNLNYACVARMRNVSGLMKKEGYLDIYGEASGGQHFVNYKLFYSENGPEGPWVEFTDNVTPGEKKAVVGPNGQMQYPLLGSLNLNLINGNIINIKLNVYDNQGFIWSNVSDFVAFVADQQQGWPQKVYGEEYGGIPLYTTIMGVTLTGSAKVANIDNSPDGSLEIVVANAQGIFVFDHQGNDMPGWPKLLPNDYRREGCLTSATPALADLDGDGALEIIHLGHSTYYDAKYQNTNEFIGGMHVWKHDGTPLQGWPQNFYLNMASGHNSVSSPVVADIDGDSQDEIVVTALKVEGKTVQGQFIKEAIPVIYAWEKNGNFVQGPNGETNWPFNLSLKNGTISRVQIYPTKEGEITIPSGPIIADLNSDGIPEVVQMLYASYKNQSTGQTEHVSTIHVLNGYGFPASSLSFPKDYDGNDLLRKGLTAADVNGSGVPELLGMTGQGRFIVINNQGAIIAQKSGIGVPASLITPANLDQDDQKEFVFITQTGRLVVLDDNLSMMPGWPYETGLPNVAVGSSEPYTSPLVADIDNDGQIDIVVAGTLKASEPFFHLYAFNVDGTVKAGWPKMFGSHPNQLMDAQHPTPTIADIDHDGDREIILTAHDGQIYVWDLSSLANPALDQWTMFRHDLKNTGSIGPDVIFPPGNQPPVANAGPDQQHTLV